jgi:hypothetical protein
VVRRIVWPITALVGLVILAVGISTVPAQPRPGMGGMMFGQVGRFAVAHASDKQIIVLDTTTGKLYKATESDYLKASAIPKVETPGGFGPPKDFKPPFKDVKPPKDFKFPDKRKDEKKEKEE